MKTFPTMTFMFLLFSFNTVFSQTHFTPLDQVAKPLNYTQLIGQISYPTPARQGGIEGLVQVQVLVDEQGNYVQHTIPRSSHPLLSQAVDPYIACLQFQPAVYKGQNVSSWTAIPVRFRLTALPGPQRKYEVICPENIQETESPIARNQ